MEQYKGFVVSEIDPITGVVTFTNGDTIRKGDVTGDVSENDMRRVQIHETILSHFEKEQELFKLGIKTLSLFFIDEVANTASTMKTETSCWASTARFLSRSIFRF